MDGSGAGGLEPIRANGARGRLAMAVWLVALAGIVGVAVVGRIAAAADMSPRAAVREVGPVDREAGSAAEVPPPSTAASPDLIVPVSPAEAGLTITTRELLVMGYLRVGIESVRVTLEARGNRVIDDATIVPALANADCPIASRLPRFEVRFGFPNPRPNGRMIVQVAAYDRDGRILDVIGRPFRVGALRDYAGA